MKFKISQYFNVTKNNISAGSKEEAESTSNIEYLILTLASPSFGDFSYKFDDSKDITIEKNSPGVYSVSAVYLIETLIDAESEGEALEEFHLMGCEFYPDQEEQNITIEECDPPSNISVKKISETASDEDDVEIEDEISSLSGELNFGSGDFDDDNY